MEWLSLSGGVPCLSLVCLGTSYRDKYYISHDCLFYLDEIGVKLNGEDPVERPLRRAIGFMDLLNKDLIPILINSKDQPNVFRATIKLLVDLTVPVECLVCVDPDNQSPSSQHTVHQLTQLLYNAKESFLEPRATRAVLDHVNRLLEQQPLSTEDSEAVNHSLLLIRNILHAPERPPCPSKMSTGSNNEDKGQQQPAAAGTSQTPYLGPHSHSHGFTADCSQQNRLLWNLFAQGLDRLLINLLASSQKKEWVVTIVQLIALFYKDQHVENMQKLLGSWLDTNNASDTTSEDDDESNTSPPIGPCNSPQMLTSSSDPTSDSSDSAQRNASTSSANDVFEAAAPVATTTSTTMTTTTTTTSKSAGRSMKNRCDSTSTSGHSDKSHRSSQNSVSSGFHSENSSTQNQQQQSNKDKTSSNRRPSYSRTNAEATVITNKVEEEPAAVETETSAKRNMKSSGNTMKTGKGPPAENKEKRRKKLNKRSRTVGPIKMKAMVHYTPTEEDISQLLKEFTVDFLLHGYNTLVGQLHQLLLQQDSLPLDKSHFLWLVTYFLRFASQLELDMDHLSDIFSIDLLCYLAWEGVRETEQFELGLLQPMADLKPCLRRLHLGVTAIREYLQALETYSRLVVQQGNGRDRVAQLRGYLPAIGALRQLFLLQLRHYNPAIQSRRYLRDVITANHVLLLTLERAVQNSPFQGCFELGKHLDQFCSRTVLARYGMALEDFKTNGPFVNDCIMTVLHHIGADLGRADLLCEPVILRPFSKIWEEEFNMCDDWDDLIEYVVQKFLRNFHSTGSAMVTGSSPDEDGAGGGRSRASNSPDHTHMHDDTFFDMTPPDIDSLRCRLLESGLQKQLNWIQSSLLTLCSARLGTYAGQEFRQPIACLSIKMKAACPIVPWTEIEANGLRSEAFLFLLHRLGLLLPGGSPVGLYPRIPCDWDSDTLYSVALMMGPVDQERVDFDLALVRKVQPPFTFAFHPSEVPMEGCPTISQSQHQLRSAAQPYLGPGPSTSFSAMPHHWMHWVEHSGSLYRSAEIATASQSRHSSNSNSHRPLDSISTTSSLEVHKTDSSDDDDMEDTTGAHPANQQQQQQRDSSSGGSMMELGHLSDCWAVSEQQVAGMSISPEAAQSD